MAFIKVDVTSDGYEGQYRSGSLKLTEDGPVPVVLYSAQEPTNVVPIVPRLSRAGVYVMTVHYFHAKDQNTAVVSCSIHTDPAAIVGTTTWDIKHMSSSWTQAVQHNYIARATKLSLMMSKTGPAVELTGCALHIHYKG